MCGIRRMASGVLGGASAFLLLGKSLRIWNEVFQRIGGSVAYILHGEGIQEREFP